MEPKIGGENIVYDPLVTNMKALGKRRLEWDLNDWKWDSGLLIAKSATNPLNTVAHDHRGSHCFPLGSELQLAPNTDVSNVIDDNGTMEFGSKKTVFVDHENEELNNDRGLLNLNLGEQVYPIVETEVDERGDVQNGMNSRNAGTSYPVCQVEGCKIDLSNVRDYNRRHKVCELHSKASEALVGNVIQRFCQQCSRFHAIEEFDGGKRSCRKRLAGHNKRRRKTLPESNPNAGPMTDGINAGQILNLLLRVLSNMHTNGSIQATDQDLLSHILRSLAVLSDGSNTSRLLQGSQSSLNVDTSNGIPEKGHSRNQEPSQTTPYAQSALTRENQIEIPQTTFVPQPQVNQAAGGTLSGKDVLDVSVEKHIFEGIDLNTVYNDGSQDCMDHMANGIGSDSRTNWAKQTLPSPPPTSGNSASTSGLASSNSGEEQSRTDRIIFKLFDKDPYDLPSVLKTQILDWLSQTPTDIEGYIRPGCIVLTLYLRLNTSIWEQFSYEISSSLTRLLDVSNDPFWKTGWIYTRIQQRAAFISDGQVILDTPLPFKGRITSISPIALPAGETVSLVVRGLNLSGPTSRLLCAIEGRYLIQENCSRLVEEGADVSSGQDIQSLSFSCSIPNVLGRGFVEVEDYDFTGCFFPFIVAEPEVCHEICMLETEMEVGSKDDYTQDYSKALEFVHEMGWLLHKNSVRMKEKQLGHPLSSFPFKRLKCLLEFSMDHEWCAVIRKLLDLLFSGIVDIGDCSSIEDGLADIALLHTAVRRNSRSMVEFLLGYVPNNIENTLILCQKKPHGGPPKPNKMLFRPDLAGVGGLTPLHIAASSASSDNVLDALLEDSGMVGIEAWKNARDSTGLTPSDYASLRGHYRYLNLVQRKINQKLSSKHVVFDIPSLSDTQTNKLKPTNFNSFYTEKPQVCQSCKVCDQMPDQKFGAAPLKFRPFMISLVAIAVVCVCTALIFKSQPQVCDIFRPFRWEALKFGAM